MGYANVINPPAPVVTQDINPTAASYTSSIVTGLIPSSGGPVLGFPANLTSNTSILMTIDGLAKTFSLVGVNASATALPEIVNSINNAFYSILGSNIASITTLSSIVTTTLSAAVTSTPTTTITVTSTAGLLVGQLVSGNPNIRTGTQIKNIVGNTLTLTKTVFSLASGITLTFSPNAATVVSSAIDSVTVVVTATSLSATGNPNLCPGGIAAGQTVVGLGIEPGTIVVSATVVSSGVSVVLSLPANVSSGTTLKFYPNTLTITSPSQGTTSQVGIQSPATGTSALAKVFGLSGTLIQHGTGPLIFAESVHYSIDYVNGNLIRIIGGTIVGPATTGIVSGTTFTDAGGSVFGSVAVNDIVTITVGITPTDYRVVTATASTLTLDAAPATGSSVHYIITRTGIKSGETLAVSYTFNPVSVDIGSLVVLDQYGNRGPRPGRFAFSIPGSSTVTPAPNAPVGAFLRINSVYEIDPVSLQQIGLPLNGLGGFGANGFGTGGFGVGGAQDYTLVVNSPSERFSMFEDSYILFGSNFSGLSLQVNFDYVPNISDYHTFVRSDSARDLNGDTLMKHFIPAYVSGTITYHAPPPSPFQTTQTPTTAALTTLVKNFINKVAQGQPLDISQIEQFIFTQIDPYQQFNCHVEPITLTATVYNTDGSTLILSSGDQIVITPPSPFPSFTTAPLTPRIATWIADNIQLVSV